MSPFAALSAGVPPVDTTVAVPPVRVRINRFDTASVELPSVLFTVEVLVYVIELAALVENRYTSAPDAPRAPSSAFPFTVVLFLIP
jgi:hypothetical protein